ncbi:MAG: hypothetical protein JW913_05450 [Chitinispirillaceae bacterium]|nr:hypothetical protein [Chitinispirillaceae bacterium]
MLHVYCYGMVSPSTVYILDTKFAFPRPNGYAETGRTIPSIGGEAANSAIILAKLGVRTKLDGNWLDSKRASKVLRLLTTYGIDTSRLRTLPHHGTEEIVIADATSRTIFGNYAAFHCGERQWNEPNGADIKNADFVALDPYFREESIDCANLCIKHSTPYVTLDCPYDGFIAQHAAAVVVSHELRNRLYLGRDLHTVFRHYLRRCTGLVIFTFGSEELWYGRRGMRMRKYRPYQITPVDTCGAGDSFRAGILYSLLTGWNDARTIDFAAAVAACVCLTTPHTLNAPGLEGVEDFMRRNRRPS